MNVTVPAEAAHADIRTTTSSGSQMSTEAAFAVVVFAPTVQHINHQTNSHREKETMMSTTTELTVESITAVEQSPTAVYSSVHAKLTSLARRREIEGNAAVGHPGTISMWRPFNGEEELGGMLLDLRNAAGDCGLDRHVKVIDRAMNDWKLRSNVRADELMSYLGVLAPAPV